MKKYLLPAAFLLFLSTVGVFFILQFYYPGDIVVLNPKGWVGMKQRDLIFLATALMFIVVVPVFLLTFFIVWKYKASHQGKYNPDWSYSYLAESIWWGIPLVIVLILSVYAWKSTYELDPYKPLVHEKERLKIQVVALDWKWLFIYPEQKIASVNFLQFPEETPIDFEITADAPMNSFWIPQLGGQVYAMPGMKTKLHLIANALGEFRGSSANLSGVGFAGMKFIAKASTDGEFAAWVESVKSSNPLGLEEYKRLAEQSSNNPVAFYTLQTENLFEEIVMKYMAPQ